MQFSDLPYDCVHNLMKYMPLNERFKLERVNKTFGEIVSSLWDAQKSLAVTRREKSWQWLWPPICYLNCHRFYGQDMFIIRKNGDIGWIKVLRRCKNLKSLTIEVTSTVYGSELAIAFNTYCLNLEHLDGVCYDAQFLANFEPSKKFKCLLISFPDPIRYLDFFKQNHSLELACLKTNDQKECLKYIDHGQLKQIHFRGQWDSSYNVLTSLKSIPSNITNADDVRHLKLTHVELYLGTNVEKLFIRHTGIEQLQLSYAKGMSHAGQLQLISKYLPKLKWFRFYCNDHTCPDQLIERLYDEVSKLAELRILEVIDIFSTHKLEVNGLKKLLISCKKLHTIEHYDGTYSYTEEEKNQIVKLLEDYADLHPKRSIKIKWTRVFDDRLTYTIPANIRLYL